jgi:hypothetical protein
MGKDVSKKDGPDAATDRHHIDVAALHEVFFGGWGGKRRVSLPLPEIGGKWQIGRSEPSRTVSQLPLHLSVKRACSIVAGSAALCASSHLSEQMTGTPFP